MAKLNFVLATFVLRFFAEHVNGVNIQFNRDSNSTYTFYESNSTAKCNNLPAGKQQTIINSIKTDTCLIVYMDRNCTGPSRKFDPDNRLGWHLGISSFHICNEDVGGPRLNIDITKWYDHFFRPNEIPDVLESYRNVCDCINVPKYVQRMTKWSINNYGNDLIGYYEPNCLENQWPSQFFEGGHWNSPEVYNYVKTSSATNIKYKIQSLGPDYKSKYFNISCNQVTGVVDNVIGMANETKQNYTLESLTLIMHNHNLEITKRFSKIEQENQNLLRQFYESEFSLRKIIAEIRQQLDEFQKIKNDLKQLFD